MDLTNLKSIDKMTKRNNIVWVTIILIMAIAFTVVMFFLITRINKLQENALIIDTRGNVYESNPVNALLMREYEYENHVRLFINSWYSFDEYNYETNIEYGLNLIGERGKELLYHYNETKLFNTIKQMNLRYVATINDLIIDMNTIPVSGTAHVTQTGYSRDNTSLSRDLMINFTLYDLSRSRENIHGCKIRDWNVTFSDTYKQ